MVFYYESIILVIDPFSLLSWYINLSVEQNIINKSPFKNYIKILFNISL